MIKACAVTITLYSWVLPNNNKLPGFISSQRINIESHNPAKPFKIPKIKYKTPISLWLVEHTQRINQFLIKVIFKNINYIMWEFLGEKRIRTFVIQNKMT